MKYYKKDKGDLYYVLKQEMKTFAFLVYKNTYFVDNGMQHNKKRAASYLISKKYYFLNNEYIGSEIEFPTKEVWRKYIKLLAFS